MSSSWFLFTNSPYFSVKDASVTNSNFINVQQLSTGHFQGKISGNYWGSSNLNDIIPYLPLSLYLSLSLRLPS